MLNARAIRGATTVENNNKNEILLYTEQLLKKIIEDNNINIEDIISIFFTATKDIDAEFPAVAAREIGLTNVPLMCAQEIDVSGSLQKCIRIMVYVNTDKKLEDFNHIYLREAERLRPDLGNSKEYTKD